MEPYPTPNLVKQDLRNILKSASFVDKIIFGKLNYNTASNQFEENNIFYKNCVDIIIDFCKKNKIKYHIKHGTQKRKHGETERIFQKNIVKDSGIEPLILPIS